jgi:hypothetical protein
MCECCTPKENLGHLYLHGFGDHDMDSLNQVLRRLPGVFRALPDDHGEAEAVVLFDLRIIDAEILKNTLVEQGFQA